MSQYKCKMHKLDLVCMNCIKAWITRHDAMKRFLLKLTYPIKDRDDYFSVWQDEAAELLKEMELFDERMSANKY